MLISSASKAEIKPITGNFAKNTPYEGAKVVYIAPSEENAIQETQAISMAA